MASQFFGFILIVDKPNLFINHLLNDTGFKEA